MTQRTEINQRLCAGLAATGLALTLFVSAYVQKETREYSRALLRQTHSSTLKVLTRDLDDMRAQLTQIFGANFRASFARLTFQTNEYGRLGVRGTAPANAWTLIANGGKSPFRAALPDRLSANAQLWDKNGELIDGNHARSARAPVAALTSFVPGTNLILYSQSLNSASPLTFLLWLCLGTLFWVEAALALYLFLERGTEPAKLVAGPAVRRFVEKIPVRALLPEVTVGENVFLNQLGFQLNNPFAEDSALVVMRISLARPEMLPGLANLLNHRLSPHGFYFQHARKASELLCVIQVATTTQLKLVMRQLKGISAGTSLDLRGLQFSGAIFYANLSTPQVKRLLSHLRGSQPYALSGEGYAKNLRPTFIKFSRAVDTATHVISFERAQEMMLWGEGNFGDQPLFLPTAPVARPKPEPAVYTVPRSPVIPASALVLKAPKRESRMPQDFVE